MGKVILQKTQSIGKSVCFAFALGVLHRQVDCTTYQCTCCFFQPTLTKLQSQVLREGELNAYSLSSGRCGNLHRCLCSVYIDPLHTTSFRWKQLYHQVL